MRKYQIFRRDLSIDEETGAETEDHIFLWETSRLASVPKKAKRLDAYRFLINADDLPTAPEVVVKKVSLSPVQFKLLFTSAERVAIKASTDPFVIDFMEIVNDPHLTQVELDLPSTQEGVNYLEMIKLIGDGRAAEILQEGQ